MGMIKLTPPDAGRYLRVNQALCTLTGYTANQLLSLRVGDITHPDDAAADAKAATEALADRRRAPTGPRSGTPVPTAAPSGSR